MQQKRMGKQATLAGAIFLAAMWLAGAAAAPASAETADERLQRLEETVAALQKEIQELKSERENSQQVQEGLAEEIRSVKLQVAAPDTEYQSYTGMGPAASKVYYSPNGVSIGGYGEVVYNVHQGETGRGADTVDAQRFILYTGYKYNDNIVMNTELEFEHAGFEGGSPEVFTEFSYMDFLLKPTFNVRAGLMLTPVGLSNEYHEPTLFHSVNRPEVERNIIPSTWRDIGLMVYGETRGGLRYKFARLNGMDASSFRGKDWIRKGRFKGSKASAEAFANVINLGYRYADLDVGLSWYNGEVANSTRGELDIFETHFTYAHKGFELRGLYVDGDLSGDAAFEAAMNAQGAGKSAKGHYLETAYDVMPLIKDESRTALYPFLRIASYDTNDSVFPGANARDSKYDRDVLTFGLDYKPHPNVTLKMDYQSKDSDDPGTANKTNQYNLGVGFLF